MDESTVRLVEAALEEDIGSGDVTAKYFTPAGLVRSAAIVAREPGVSAGVEVARLVFEKVDPSLELEVLKKDGDSFEKGDALLRVWGDVRGLLTAERTALNFLQRLCGVATVARAYMKAVEGTEARVLDTRKTTPGWRLLEKAAVKAGGGFNHRMGLYDAAMVKDNHLLADDRQEALQAAIDRLKTDRPEVKVELEVDTLQQLERFLKLEGVDVILLDNMNLDQLRQAVAMNHGSEPPGASVELEASGGVTLETVAAIAATGVDWISVGALTHSVRSLDLSMELEAEGEGRE